MKKAKKTGRTKCSNLLLLCASLLFALVLSEIFLRTFVRVRNVGPVFSEYSATYGKRLKKNFHAKRITPEFSFELTTNSYGFRGPEPNSFPRHPILCLGDSFSMGYGVNDGEEFPELLRRELAGNDEDEQIHVINFSIENNGNGRWLKFLRGEATRYDPWLVILQLTGNDFSDNVSEGLFSLNAGGTLTENQVPPKGWLRRIQEPIERIPGLSFSHVFCLLRRALSPWPDRNLSFSAMFGTAWAQPQHSTYEERLTFAILDEVLQTCKRNRYPVIVILVDVEQSRQNKLVRFFRRYSLEPIMIPSKVKRPDLYYMVDGHWNAEGHEYVMRLLLERIPDMKG